MKLQYVLLATIIFPLLSVNAADYTVDCEAFNAETSADVTGTCSNGKYEGIDAENGNAVEGDCEDYGEVSAYDSVTGEYVYGECEGVKN